MTEPGSTTGIVLGTGIITLTGSILGLQLDALLLGVFGGLLSLQHVAPLASRWQVVSSLGTASILGAALSPFAGGFMHQFTWVDSVPADSPRLAFAVVIGMGAQFIVPLFIKVLKARVEQ